MEDVINAGTAKAFYSTFLHELAFNHLTVRIGESVDEV